MKYAIAFVLALAGCSDPTPSPDATVDAIEATADVPQDDVSDAGVPMDAME